MGEDRPTVKKRGGWPVLWRVPAAWRLLRSRQAPLWQKALVLAGAAYVVMPLDLIPDAIPLIGWLDDVGIIVACAAVLQRALSEHRGGPAESDTDSR